MTLNIDEDLLGSLLKELGTVSEKIDRIKLRLAWETLCKDEEHQLKDSVEKFLNEESRLCETVSNLVDVEKMAFRCAEEMWQRTTYDREKFVEVVGNLLTKQARKKIKDHAKNYIVGYAYRASAYLNTGIRREISRWRQWIKEVAACEREGKDAFQHARIPEKKKDYVIPCILRCIRNASAVPLELFDEDIGPPIGILSTSKKLSVPLQVKIDPKRCVGNECAKEQLRTWRQWIKDSLKYTTGKENRCKLDSIPNNKKKYLFERVSWHIANFQNTKDSKSVSENASESSFDQAIPDDRIEFLQEKIEQELLGGYETCVQICPDVFEMKHRKAIVKKKLVEGELAESLEEARDCCPTQAISIQAEIE